MLRRMSIASLTSKSILLIIVTDLEGEQNGVLSSLTLNPSRKNITRHANMDMARHNTQRPTNYTIYIRNDSGTAVAESIVSIHIGHRQLIQAYAT